MANNNRLQHQQPHSNQPQPPRASSSGLHLPITSLASLHAKPSNNADNGSLSSSNTKTKTTTVATASSKHSYIQNNNVKPKKAAGFSLPLNNLPSVLPKSTMQQANAKPLIHQQTAPEPLESNNAQSKRCRFALKDNSNTNQTSTSSNASTVIEQNAVSQRRSRSPKRSLMQGQHHQPLNSNAANASASATLHHGNQGGVEFRAPLMIEQAEELMLMAKAGKSHPLGLQLVSAMPHGARGGTMYLVRTSTFQKGGGQDGYLWTEILHQSDLITTKENHLDYRHYYISSSLGDGRRTRTSSKFRREAYTMGDLTLVTYIGDEKEAATDSMLKPPQPPVSLQASTFHSLPRSHRYDKRPGSSRSGGGQAHPGGGHASALRSADRRLHSSASNVRPRSLERASNEVLEHEMQLRRLQAKSRHSAMVQSTNGQSELMRLSEELAAGKLVKNLTLFPALQITLVHPDMTREFEQACQVLYSDPLLLLGPSTIRQPQDGLRLFYDVTFPMGRLFVTILTFVNACYEGHPIMPLAVNIHERQFKSSHSLFWARVVGDIPGLQKHRFPLMIDDAEPAVHLAVRAQAPNLVQLEGWSHRFRDIDRYLRTKGYGEEAINYFKACVCYLLNSPSKQAMHDRFRKEFEYVWPKDFVLYYRQKLLPRSGRLGRWAMAKLNICENSFLSPHANPQERFFKLVNGFRHWETLSLEQLIRAFNYLFIFFINELSLRDTANGAFVLKTAYQPHFHQFHHPRWQNHARVPHPTEIVSWVTRQHPCNSRGPMPPLTSGNFRPQMIAYTDASTAAFAPGESFDDVQEMEEALDRMFRESEEDDATALFDEFIKPTFLNHQKLRQTQYMTHQNNSSSFSSNVPSPAPNGQVPSPAPPEIGGVATTKVGAEAGGGTIKITQSQNQPQLNVTSSSSNSVGQQQQQQQQHHPRSSALSTIPEVSSQREGSLNNLNNNIKTSQPPDLIVHSGSNWQEHSFDSSVVTEGHYDASFESEVLPTGPQTTSANVTTAVTTSSGNSNESSRPRPPPLAHSAKKSVFSVSGNLSSVNEEPKPSGMMLWKKVQTYVAVGGAFVSSAATNNGTNEQHQSTTTSSDRTGPTSVKTVTTTQPTAVTTVTH